MADIDSVYYLIVSNRKVRTVKRGSRLQKKPADQATSHMHRNNRIVILRSRYA